MNTYLQTHLNVAANYLTAPLNPIIRQTAAFLGHRAVVTALKFSTPMIAIVLTIEGLSQILKKRGYQIHEAKSVTPSSMICETLGLAVASYAFTKLAGLDEAKAAPYIYGPVLGITTGHFSIYATEKVENKQSLLSQVSLVASMAIGVLLFVRAANAFFVPN